MEAGKVSYVVAGAASICITGNCGGGIAWFMLSAADSLQLYSNKMAEAPIINISD
jgi:hypothetical protein